MDDIKERFNEVIIGITGSTEVTVFCFPQNLPLKKNWKKHLNAKVNEESFNSCINAYFAEGRRRINGGDIFFGTILGTLGGWESYWLGGVGALALGACAAICPLTAPFMTAAAFDMIMTAGPIATAVIGGGYCAIDGILSNKKISEKNWIHFYNN